MDQVFITELTIQKVRHLENITIPLSKDHIKHLILTGKNGSGKTSVVEAMAEYLENAFTNEFFEANKKNLGNAIENKNNAVKSGADEAEILKWNHDVCALENKVMQNRKGLDLHLIMI